MTSSKLWHWKNTILQTRIWHPNAKGLGGVGGGTPTLVKNEETLELQGSNSQGKIISARFLADMELCWFMLSESLAP